MSTFFYEKALQKYLGKAAVINFCEESTKSLKFTQYCSRCMSGFQYSTGTHHHRLSGNVSLPEISLCLDLIIIQQYGYERLISPSYVFEAKNSVNEHS